MALPFNIDFKNPDYERVILWRVSRLQEIRKNKNILPALFKYYADNPIDFIEDWGMTFDPRNAGTELPAAMPFILFPKQREFLEAVLYAWKNKEPLIVEKSRDVGISWLSVALSCTLCLFNQSLIIGFGSRKEEYVDRIGAPKALFYKARQFMSLLPREFLQGWSLDADAPYMRIKFPATDSAITGEAGTSIGRGDRTSLYFIDEAAHLERPHLIDASLSATTNCRIDMSSVNGMDNPFAIKRHSGKFKVFVFDWRDDPRKDDEWYQKQVQELDPVTVAQEIDRNYSASVRGILIPSEWVQAAVDAHIKLDIKITGEKRGALDVADEGKDLNAFAAKHGILVQTIKSWSGKGSDIYASVEKTFDFCDDDGIKEFCFDSDGLGSGCRGDARIINEKRKAPLTVTAFRGSESPVNPEKEMVEGRTNADFFANRKAQGWWNLRMLFRNTYRAIVEKREYDKDAIISISSASGEFLRLITELSQVTYDKNNAGKIIIDKAPDGTQSPNHADAVMMLFAPQEKKPRGFFDL